MVGESDYGAPLVSRDPREVHRIRFHGGFGVPIAILDMKTILAHLAAALGEHAEVLTNRQHFEGPSSGSGICRRGSSSTRKFSNIIFLLEEK